jgi:NADP-dependent 3-hydroxy acid dehydrogenase YdfG
MGALDGRKVLITGASSGIGEAAAMAMAHEGAAVALGARRRDRLEEIVAGIESEGGTAHAVAADVTDEEKARRLVGDSAELLGGLDCLVNNAGVMLLGLVEGADTADWRRMVEVNLLGLLYCTHAALPLLREGGGGDIVNVASVAGRVASLGSGVYNMTKWGVVGFSESLRQEGAHIGVRVTCVEPGFVGTELQGHNQNPLVVEQLEKMREATGKVLEADDIARAIVYAVAQPKHVSINELLVRPTGQAR